PALSVEITVTDGDTVRLGDERIRLLGIDAPETHSPACLSEKLLGQLASRRIGQLLAKGPVTIERHGLDKYRRTLAIVRVGGHDIGAIMVAEGYARPWLGRKVDWCGGKP
ncbi:MAG: thermonuclease family protein, partial [Bauldia sp.]